MEVDGSCNIKQANKDACTMFGYPLAGLKTLNMSRVFQLAGTAQAVLYLHTRMPTCLAYLSKLHLLCPTSQLWMLAGHSCCDLQQKLFTGLDSGPLLGLQAYLEDVKDNHCHAILPGVVEFFLSDCEKHLHRGNQAASTRF